MRYTDSISAGAHFMQRRRTAMSLYAIGDLHLSLGCPEKDMALFGGRWVGYTEKIRASFSQLREEDTVVLCGDSSWGMSCL